jgi:hypothetical protein
MPTKQQRLEAKRCRQEANRAAKHKAKNAEKNSGPKAITPQRIAEQQKKYEQAKLNLYFFTKQNCTQEQDDYGNWVGPNSTELNRRHGILTNAVSEEYSKLLTLQKRSGREYEDLQSTYDSKAAAQLIGSSPTRKQLALFKLFQNAHYCSMCSTSRHNAPCRNNPLVTTPCLNIIFALAPDGKLGEITTYFSPLGCSCEQGHGYQCDACEKYEDVQTTCDNAKTLGHNRRSCEECADRQIAYEESWTKQINPMRTSWEFIPDELNDFVQDSKDNIRCKVEHQQFGPFQAEMKLFLRGLEMQKQRVQTRDFQNAAVSAQERMRARNSQRNHFQIA